MCGVGVPAAIHLRDTAGPGCSVCSIKRYSSWGGAAARREKTRYFASPFSWFPISQYSPYPRLPPHYWHPIYPTIRFISWHLSIPKTFYSWHCSSPITIPTTGIPPKPSGTLLFSSTFPVFRHFSHHLAPYQSTSHLPFFLPCRHVLSISSSLMSIHVRSGFVSRCCGGRKPKRRHGHRFEDL